jgi:hypothetical protein
MVPGTDYVRRAGWLVSSVTHHLSLSISLSITALCLGLRRQGYHPEQYSVPTLAQSSESSGLLAWLFQKGRVEKSVSLVTNRRLARL